MPVFTIVHRVLPPLLWKRRSLKGKSREIINEKNPSSITPHHETINETIMHRDVHTHVHIAVNTKTLENTADSTSESRRYSSRPTQAQLARAVSWASIRSRDRWTEEQEKELLRAQRQLGRCQKAWSSEQEVWLSYVQALSEEKEAHAGFLSMRHRQETEEQHQFRKAWKRRRSSSDEESAGETVNRIGKLRRLQRSVSSSGRLGMGSAVLAVEA
ncbi:uncharacterized protein PGRI_053530 [Penicillium griseofulvum]|uniref:Uncharacterized protein n=1 Tax=Penicillium patulum TaxID=5078 RepID=A0A135LBZ4_PENPA|nr:uncharacterized protein PGRI_053530 [Penicillium griseofulvum]KXG46497.1 hypothetical protein PGRI_053530 [Penicillium griseofulvum]